MVNLASIIIPMWNGQAYIEACLTALLAQEYTPTEIIVVDNASTDESARVVAEKFPQVRLLCHRHNLGFAGGCNTGLKAAKGEVLVLLNQDTCVSPGWLRALCDALQAEKIGVVGSKIYYPDGETLQHAGARLEWPLGLAKHDGQGEKDTGAWDTPRPVEFVTGAALAFRRDLLARIGYLDELFWPGYFEDADFCLRAREAGTEVWYIPQATLIHAESSSFDNQELKSKTYQRGRLRFILKHMPPARFLAEFVPAEIAAQPAAIRGYESQALRLAYLEAIPAAAPILRQRWQADPATIHEVTAALGRLHRLAWAEDWEKSKEPMAGIPPIRDFTPEQVPPDAVPIAPLPAPLEDYKFESNAPLIGPLLVYLRSQWFNVAARWAFHQLLLHFNKLNELVNTLQNQQAKMNWRQETINLQQEQLNQHYIHTLERRLMELAEENALLARQVADISRQNNNEKE
jgi:GT2 family glycosyltransferase